MDRYRCASPSTGQYRPRMTACSCTPNPRADDFRRSLNCASFLTRTTLGTRAAPTSGSSTGIPSHKSLPPISFSSPSSSRSPCSLDMLPTTVPRPVSTTPAVMAPTAASGNGRRPCLLHPKPFSQLSSFWGIRPILVMGGATLCWVCRMRWYPASRNGRRRRNFISGRIRTRRLVRGWCMTREVWLFVGRVLLSCHVSYTMMFIEGMARALMHRYEDGMALGMR